MSSPSSTSRTALVTALTTIAVLAAGMIVPQAASAASGADPAEPASSAAAWPADTVAFTVGEVVSTFSNRTYRFDDGEVAFGDSTDRITLDIDRDTYGPVTCTADAWFGFSYPTASRTWSEEEWADSSERSFAITPTALDPGNFLVVTCQSGNGTYGGWRIFWYVYPVADSSRTIVMAEGVIEEPDFNRDQVTYGPGADDPTTVALGDRVRVVAEPGFWPQADNLGPSNAYLTAVDSRGDPATTHMLVTVAPDGSSAELLLPRDLPAPFHGPVNLRIDGYAVSWTADLTLLPEPTTTRVALNRSLALSVQRVSATAVVATRSGLAPVGEVVFTIDGADVRRVRLAQYDRGRISVQLPQLSRGVHHVAARFEVSGVLSSTSAPTRVRVLL